MNPLTNMKNVLKLSEYDLKKSANNKSSWHDMYRDSAWIFVGGLPYTLTEGDIICVFSQYGEIVNINLGRDKDSGKSKGYCFICYEDQRSTTLAVDNLNGIKILNRAIRVDHVSNYRPPKEYKHTDTETLQLYMQGCAPQPQLPNESIKIEESDIMFQNSVQSKKQSPKKSKKHRKSKKHKKHKMVKRPRRFSLRLRSRSRSHSSSITSRSSCSSTRSSERQRGPSYSKRKYL